MSEEALMWLISWYLTSRHPLWLWWPQSMLIGIIHSLLTNWILILMSSVWSWLNVCFLFWCWSCSSHDYLLITRLPPPDAVMSMDWCDLMSIDCFWCSCHLWDLLQGSRFRTWIIALLAYSALMSRTHSEHPDSVTAVSGLIHCQMSIISFIQIIELD